MVGLVVGLVVGAGLVVGWPATTPGADEPQERDERDDEVTLPDAEASGDVSDDADDPTSGTDPDAARAFGCQPTGCERWRIDEDGFGHRHVDEDTLVYVSDEAFRILDLDAADLRFAGQIPLPEGIDPSDPPQAVQRLGGLLVLAYGDQLVAIELLSNRRAWWVDLDGSDARGLHRHEDGILAIGSGEGSPVQDADVGERDDAGDPPTHVTTILTSISSDGSVRWQHETEAVPVLTPDPAGAGGARRLDPLVTADDDVLTSISLSDGQPRWQRGLAPDERVVGGSPLAVVDDVAGYAEVLDVDTGASQRRLRHGQIRAVEELGPWWQVITDEAIHVHERASGRELFRRDLSDGIDPGHPATAEVIEDGEVERVAVAWRRSGRGAGPRIEILDPDAASRGTVDIDLPAAADRIQPGMVQLAALDAGRLQVVVEGGRSVTEIDVSRIEVVRSASRTVPSDADVMIFGGVSAIDDGDGLLVLGAGGEVQVHGRAPMLAHREPLLVSDGTELLRIDEAALEGRAR